MVKLEICWVVWALAAWTACKGKPEKSGDPLPAGSATTAAPGSAVAPPSHRGAKLASGQPRLGCIGWSPTSKSAACVTGMQSATASENTYAVSYVGTPAPATKLAFKTTDAGDVLEEPSVSDANATLERLGVEPFAAPAQKIAAAGTTDLGKGATLVWTSKKTDDGGENQPETHKHTIVAKCGATTTELYASEGEGMNPTLAVWSFGDHAVIEVITTRALEGESSVEHSVRVIELATCTVTSSLG